MKQLINFIDYEAAATAQDQYSSAGIDKNATVLTVVLVVPGCMVQGCMAP